MVLIFAIAAGLFNGPQSMAEVQCPWLNAATAAGVLGGEVQSTVSPLMSEGDTTCDFRRTEHSTVLTLTIAVHTMALPSKDYPTYLAQCAGAAVPLKAIGNEAIQCVLSNSSSNGTEQIIGRVRERVFIIDLKRGSTGQSPSSQIGLSYDARNVAEQVAGTLF